MGRWKGRKKLWVGKRSRWAKKGRKVDWPDAREMSAGYYGTEQNGKNAWGKSAPAVIGSTKLGDPPRQKKGVPYDAGANGYRCRVPPVGAT